MFQQEIATARHAELLRRAADYRLARQARKAVEARRGSARGQEPEGPVREQRSRFVRVA
ncbi:hypothetical protein [Streptomyces sp. NPDC048603]|uniref:hypothetical protein n=1 Tax=Streptomyces sp. NPDC048603 TaxID=3365577 RepID=UPI00370FF35B